MFHSVTRSFFIIHIWFLYYSTIPFCFIHLAKNIKFDAFDDSIDDLYFQTWDHTLQLLIASLQLRNSNESHRVKIVKACRRLSYKTSELHFEISLRRFSFHRSPSSYRKRRGKNSGGNRYGETRLVLETLQTISASPVPSSSLLFREKSIARRTRARFSRSRWSRWVRIRDRRLESLSTLSEA